MTLADDLDQTLDSNIMQMVAGREYVDGNDLQEFEEHLRDDLCSWQPLSGGSLRSRIVAACHALDIKVQL